jgi:hypothetical protein
VPGPWNDGFKALQAQAVCEKVAAFRAEAERRFGGVAAVVMGGDFNSVPSRIFNPCWLPGYKVMGGRRGELAV